MSMSLRGVFPPIPTPFDADENVDLGALSANLERWNAYDLAGYVVLGSNGEAVFLDDRERIAVLERARRAIPADKLMVAGTGCESARETIALTQQAAAVGADAVLVMTPHYYGAMMKPDGLVGYYCAVADASPIPVLLYNVPKFTRVDMDVSIILRAAEHANIAGIKDSSGNVAKLADIVRLTSAGFQVLVGTAGVLFAGLAVGAVGGVVALANVAPQQSIDIQRLTEAGRWGEALELQRQMMPVNAAVTGRFGIAGLKAALDMLGYRGGSVRLPLQGIDADDRDVLRDILIEGGVLGSAMSDTQEE
ncbi:MAG: dihydrodipicolinate synthase family protein [Chloroflexi bacterium]|nr:dihydrodipicolinate synthase family protein [Chloroflexota bacterium]